MIGDPEARRSAEEVAREIDSTAPSMNALLAILTRFQQDVERARDAEWRIALLSESARDAALAALDGADTRDDAGSMDAPVKDSGEPASSSPAPGEEEGR